MARPSVATSGLVVLALAIFILAAATQADDAAAIADKLPPPAKIQVDFSRDVKPLFAKYCLSCHGPDKQQAGLRLDVQGEAVRGGDSGPAFVAGQSGTSLLIKYVAGLDPDIVMPPEGDKLSKDDVALLRAWIDQGVKWSDGSGGDAKANATHWSFRPIRRPELPKTKAEAWIRKFDRSICPRETRIEENYAGPRGRSPHTDPPALARFAGIAANTGRNSCLSRRRSSRRLRIAGRPAAGVAALWRTLGPSLAGPRPLRRQRRLRKGLSPPLRLALSQLGHRRDQ